MANQFQEIGWRENNFLSHKKLFVIESLTEDKSVESSERKIRQDKNVKLLSTPKADELDENTFVLSRNRWIGNRVSRESFDKYNSSN